MLFGKIDFINLLPFHIFLKKRLRRSYQKLALHKRKGVPSHINRMLESGRIDAAVISSIKSFRYRCSDMGIVSKDEVLSVLVIPGKTMDDSQSDTSNALAKVLGIKGRVLIGDKALAEYLKGIQAVDLGREWKKRTRLPFVYARLCYTKDKARYEALGREFVKKRVKIPYYLVKRKSAASGISVKDIGHYLTKISYTIGPKEKLALKTFRHGCKKRGIR